MNIQRILVPIDFSQNAMKVMPHVVGFARAFRAEIELLYVLEMTPYDVYQQLGIFDAIPPQLQPGHEGDDISPQGIMRRAREEAEKKLKGIVPADLASQFKVVVREGKPVHTILDEAKNSGADMMILCTHGWTGLNHLILGSNTEKLVRTSPIPVFTIRGDQVKEKKPMPGME